MNKVWAVSTREYRTNVRSKGFLIGVILMPILMLGSVLVQVMVQKRGDSSIKRLAVVDHSGRMFNELHEAAAARNEKDIFDPETRRQMSAKFELFEMPPAQDRRAQLLELSDRVRKEEFYAVVEIDPNIFTPGAAADAKLVRYYTNKSTYRDLPEWLSKVIGERVRSVRFMSAGLDPVVVREALTPVSIESFGLLSTTATGEIKEAEESNIFAGFMAPFVVMMLMWMLLMIGVQPLLHGVLEEKMQRISEVLLGSMRPFDLMLGKLLGHTLVAMTLLGIYAIGGYGVAMYYGKTDMVDPALLAWFVVFLTLAMFMYGSMFLAAGACCNELKEAQSLIMPVMFPMIIPLFFLMPIIRDPTGLLSTVLSLVPLTAPMIMTMRHAMEAPVPAWQTPVAIIGCLGLALACVWAAGRIFRVGLLMQGKPPKIGEMIKWAIHG